VRGTITEIHRQQQRGTIRGEDGQTHHFEREGMVRWLEFNELKPGDAVVFELEATGSAINVERADGEAPRR
jgi:hypothetical protein